MRERERKGVRLLQPRSRRKRRREKEETAASRKKKKHRSPSLLRGEEKRQKNDGKKRTECVFEFTHTHRLASKDTRTLVLQRSLIPCCSSRKELMTVLADEPTPVSVLHTYRIDHTRQTIQQREKKNTHTHLLAVESGSFAFHFRTSIVHLCLQQNSTQTKHKAKNRFRTQVIQLILSRHTIK